MAMKNLTCKYCRKPATIYRLIHDNKEYLCNAKQCEFGSRLRNKAVGDIYIPKEKLC